MPKKSNKFRAWVARTHEDGQCYLFDQKVKVKKEYYHGYCGVHGWEYTRFEGADGDEVDPWVFDMCYRGWKKATGVTVRKGRVREIEITIKEVKK